MPDLHQLEKALLERIQKLSNHTEENVSQRLQQIDSKLQIFSKDLELTKDKKAEVMKEVFSLMRTLSDG